MAHWALAWLSWLDMKRELFHLQSQPWMRFERLLGPVTVVVEKFLAGIDGVLGDQDQSGDLADHHHLGHAVRADSAVVDQPTVPPRLCGGVNTAQYSVSKVLSVKDRTYQYCLPLCLK